MKKVQEKKQIKEQEQMLLVKLEKEKKERELDEFIKQKEGLKLEENKEQDLVEEENKVEETPPVEEEPKDILTEDKDGDDDGVIF